MKKREFSCHAYNSLCLLLKLDLFVCIFPLRCVEHCTAESIITQNARARDLLALVPADCALLQVARENEECTLISATPGASPLLSTLFTLTLPRSNFVMRERCWYSAHPTYDCLTPLWNGEQKTVLDVIRLSVERLGIKICKLETFSHREVASDRLWPIFRQNRLIIYTCNLIFF